MTKKKEVSPKCKNLSRARLWVACDSCAQWYHMSCVSVTKVKVEKTTWICPVCVQGRPKELHPKSALQSQESSRQPQFSFLVICVCRDMKSSILRVPCLCFNCNVWYDSMCIRIRTQSNSRTICPSCSRGNHNMQVAIHDGDICGLPISSAEKSVNSEAAQVSKDKVGQKLVMELVEHSFFTGETEKAGSLLDLKNLDQTKPAERIEEAVLTGDKVSPPAKKVSLANISPVCHKISSDSGQDNVLSKSMLENESQASTLFYNSGGEHILSDSSNKMMTPVPSMGKKMSLSRLSLSFSKKRKL